MGALQEAALGDQSPVLYEVRSFPPPAAGADLSVVVPGHEAWQVIAFHFQLAASAAVANRNVRLSLDNQSVVFARVGSPSSVTASQTIDFTALPGVAPAAGVTSALVLPLPAPTILGPGAEIKTITANIDAADQFSVVTAYIRRILVGVTEWALADQAVEELYTNPI